MIDIAFLYNDNKIHYTNMHIFTHDKYIHI